MVLICSSELICSGIISLEHLINLFIGMSGGMRENHENICFRTQSTHCCVAGRETRMLMWDWGTWNHFSICQARARS
jgi:hypothetical protein